MGKLEVAVRRVVPSVPAALKALDGLGRQLTSAKTYDEIRRVIKEARAIKILMTEVEEIRHKAEDVILDATVRIGEELERIPKAAGPGRGKHLPHKGNVLGKEATGVPHSSRSRLTKLAKAGKTVIEKAKAKLRKDGKPVNPTSVGKVLDDEAKAAQRKAAYEAGVRDGCTVEDLESLADSGERFGVLYPDPPWKFYTYSGKGKGRSADKEYDTMTIADICAMGPTIQKLAAKDCAMFLWIVWSELPGALEVIKAWGFEYKTCAFVWVKEYPVSDSEFMGMGYWTRANTEVCLLATKGNPLRLNKDVRQVIEAPLGEHSEKPDEIRDRIRRLVPGPYLELFGRKPVDGWTVWGNQVSKRTLFAAE